MNKRIFSSLTSLLLAAATAVAMAGCAAAPLSETGGAAPLSGATAGEVPLLTTPSYHSPAKPEADETYTPEYQLQLLADRDFGGAVFLVVQEKGLENAIFPSADELTEVYADRRNRLVQEKYNVQLACIEMTREEILSGLSAAKTGNDFFCDLLVVSPALLTQLKAKSLLQSLDSLPFFETDSVCIRADATQEINSGWSGIYGIWGDAMRQPTKAYAVYYNKTLSAELECENFYAKVQSGEWDWSSFLAPASAGSLAFDGDLSSLVFASTGVLSATEEGAALLADPDFSALIEALEVSRYLPAETEIAEENTDTGAETESPLDAFLNGKALFYIGKLEDLSSFATAEMQVGVLPLPKYDSSAEDYPYLVDQQNLPILACPVNVTSGAGTGIMLSALNAASCDEIEEIFLQSAETQVRDNGSTIMLPYCLGSLHFDRKLIYGE